MDPIVLLGLTLLVSLNAYALLGGADYGGGVWDLLATGPTAERQRDTIARAIGPVWEANHVWLIVAVVLVFSGFPHAFAAFSTYLHVPLLIVLIGIVMRGSAFVFRAYGAAGVASRQLWGRVFAIASLITPMFLGVVVGAITEGRVPSSPRGSFTAVYIAPWLTPFSLAVGLFALALFAYLAAVYLTLECRDADVCAAFRRRAIAAGVLVAILAAAVLWLAAPPVRSALLWSPWALPLHIATAVSAVAAFYGLWTRHFVFARVAAILHVTLILWGWGLAQYPFAIRPDLTLWEAAAPPHVAELLLLVLAGGSVVLLPSLWYLFTIFGPRGEPLHMRRPP